MLLITGWAAAPEDLVSESEQGAAGGRGDTWLHCIKGAPHEWVFPRCCAVIHHGGAGTTARVLQAGVPSVIVPILIGTDQPWWADRVEEIGCGVHVRGGAPGLEEIRAGLAAGLRLAEEDVGGMTSLARVAREIAAEDGVGNFVAQVEALAAGALRTTAQVTPVTTGNTATDKKKNTKKEKGKKTTTKSAQQSVGRTRKRKVRGGSKRRK